MTSTALMTDHYELTMLDAALRSGVANRQAAFSLFTRSLPQGRRYGAVAGTQRALEAVRDFTFTEQQLSWLEDRAFLTSETLNYLKNYKFNGEIHGYREGETYFSDSPIMTVTGTFAECVLLETVLLSIMNHDSAVAAAASRMVNAANGRNVMEMGSRRTHESSAVAAARAAYIAGFNGTSNLEAGIRFNIPTFGTSAHAFTLAHSDELEAFRAQVAALGARTTLLVDTYDTEQGIRNAVAVAGPELGAIRIDSGDLYIETVNARLLLDSLGAVNTKIVVSSDLDEHVIADLMDRNAPIDSFGAGTRVVTGSGHPTCGMVYKLVEIEESDGSMKRVSKNSHGKESIGGRKNVWRMVENGVDVAEVISPDNLKVEGDYREVTTLLYAHGEIVENPSLEEMRNIHREAVKRLGVYGALVYSAKPIIPTVKK